MLELLLEALQNEPLLVKDLPIAYGETKHPDHERLEQQLRRVGWVQQDNGMAGIFYQDVCTFVCQFVRLAPQPDLPEMHLGWDDSKGEPEFFLIHRDLSDYTLTPLSNVKEIDETGSIILSDDTVLCTLHPPPEEFLRALDTLEHAGFNLMQTGDLDAVALADEGLSPVHFFKKGDEVVAIYQDQLTDQPMAEHMEIEEGSTVGTRGAWRLGDFLRVVQTGSFGPQGNGLGPS